MNDRYWSGNPPSLLTKAELELITKVLTHKQGKPTMKVNPLDDDRPGLTQRQLIGLATLTGNSGVAADLHDYHPPTQRVSRGNTQSNACILPPETTPGG
jgi:hypothetical protein